MASILVRRIIIEGFSEDKGSVIDIDLSKDITAVVGPNGSGKSTSLLAIKAILEGDLLYFLTVHYSSISLELYSYEMEGYINVFVEIPKRKPRREQSNQVVLRYGTGCGDKKVYNFISTEDISSYLSTNYAAKQTYESIAADTLFGIDTSSDVEKITKVYKANKSNLRTFRYHINDDWLNVASKFKCSYLGTDRAQLVTREMGELDGLTQFTLQFSKKPQDIRILADDMQGKIANAGTEYSRISQDVDRNFAANVLASSNKPANPAMLDAALNSYISILGKLRRLNLISDNHVNQKLPDIDSDHPLVTNMMLLYYINSAKKLMPFDRLATRVSIFQKLLGRRINDKSFSFNPRIGIQCHTEKGPIELSELSSGEKHLFVVFYYVCFVADPGTITMIDEPELSWNINWQENFIKDLYIPMRVTNSQLIFASHSPLILEKNLDIVQEIGRE